MFSKGRYWPLLSQSDIYKYLLVGKVTAFSVEPCHGDFLTSHPISVATSKARLLKSNSIIFLFNKTSHLTCFCEVPSGNKRT